MAREKNSTKSTNDGREREDYPTAVGRIRDWKYERHPRSPERFC